MFWWTIKHIVFSFLFIFTLHQIYTYFKNQLTVPKINDLVQKPHEEYIKMFESIRNHGRPDVETKPTHDNSEMKQNLKQYLSQISKLPDFSSSQTEHSNNTLAFENYDKSASLGGSVF